MDVIDWLDDDLRSDVDLTVASVEDVLPMEGELFDRILLVETMEHLEAPWTLLRAAARSVAPGGRIVVTTPNIASLRHRIELLMRGRLTAFRPENLPHVTPILPHVVARVLRAEGLHAYAPVHAGRDIIPWTGGRLWPAAAHNHLQKATSISVIIVGQRAAPGQT